MSYFANYAYLGTKFCQQPVRSPQRDGSFPTLGSIFQLFVSELGRIRKKTWPTRQKVFPLPTVRASSASNSPSALSAQALRMNIDPLVFTRGVWWELIETCLVANVRGTDLIFIDHFYSIKHQNI